ncbi:5-hydroxytryptamine receptor 3B [Callorhinchus milii]|uniref:5-hydroxytryptamine receptor 3B n=1 Tax=Callorhinchus milii TaxID=7868 RepID=UPI001C3F940C|nr:5-hydroxytryptamine receptor 3B [Callorhinchus milii]
MENLYKEPSVTFPSDISPRQRLTEKLLKRYNKGVRPVKEWSTSTTIYIDFVLHAVLEVDGQNQKLRTSVWYRQVWTDEFLRWNPKNFDGISEISLPAQALWVPDIIITEFIDVGKSPHLPYVYLNASGAVNQHKPMQVVSACSLEIYAFPFDTQNCTFTFCSWLHTVNDVNLTLWRSFAEIEKDTRVFLDDGEWELLSVPSKYAQMHLEGRDYAQIQFNVVIRRRPLLYVVSLMLPSIFLMIVDVISYYLPPNSSGRITFKSSILLGYTVFRMNISNDLPATAIQTPLIGVFFTVCMALLVISLAQSILVVKLLDMEEGTEISSCLSRRCPTRDNSSSPSTADSLCPSLKTPETISDDGDSEGNFGAIGEQDGRALDHETRLPTKGPAQEVLEEITSLRRHLEQLDGGTDPASEWLALCYTLDRLLFRLYLLILSVYTVTMSSLWLIWSSP